jgi:hypothetical protein
MKTVEPQKASFPVQSSLALQKKRARSGQDYLAAPRPAHYNIPDSPKQM